MWFVRIAGSPRGPILVILAAKDLKTWEYVLWIILRQTVTKNSWQEFSRHHQILVGKNWILPLRIEFELRRSRPQYVAKIELTRAVIENLLSTAQTEAPKDWAELARFSKKFSGASEKWTYWREQTEIKLVSLNSRNHVGVSASRIWTIFCKFCYFFWWNASLTSNENW